MGKTWERFLTLVGLGFWIFDFVTDIWTLISYLMTQSTTIVVLSAISMVPSTLAGLVLLYMVWDVVKKGDKHNNNSIITLKVIETMVESIPQLTINLYVLSIGGQNTTAFQNVSTVEPIYTVRNISTSLNTSVYESHISTEEPSYVSTSVPFAESQNVPTIQYISAAASFIGICVGIVSFDKFLASEDADNFDWLETILLFMTKTFAILARILLLAYLAFFLGWWTAIFLVGHTICLIILMIITGFFNESKLCKNILWGVLMVTLFQSVWIMSDNEKWVTIIFGSVYSIENIVLLVISPYVKIYFDEYCLYPNVLSANVSLNLACICFALIFTFKRRRKNETVEGITEQIGDWSEKTVQVIENGFSQCFASLRQRLPNILCTSDGSTIPTYDKDDESDSRDSPCGDCDKSRSETVNDESNQSATINEKDALVEYDETEV